MTGRDMTDHDLARRGDEIAHAIRRVRGYLDELGGVNVRIVAVAKGFPWSDVRVATAAGVTMIGENYAQEILAKYSSVPVQERPKLHLIGRLQSNKIRSLVGVVDVWQSVDRASLIDEIVKRAPGARIYVQVNATGEPDKGGCAPDDTGPLVERARHAGLRVEGLMTVGPTTPDPDMTRRAFSLVRALADRLGLAGCSMGMSGDVDIALAEGSTLVRVGTALFGERP